MGSYQQKTLLDTLRLAPQSQSDLERFFEKERVIHASDLLPLGTRVGNAHLQVSDVRKAAGFHNGVLELWLAGPNRYSDIYAGAVVTDKRGTICSRAPSCPRLPVDLLTSTWGSPRRPPCYQTECFSRQGTTTGVLDIVLEPGG